MTKTLACLSILIAFAASGGLVGWFAGASESPVVASVLPLFLGLIGAASYGFLDRKLFESRVAERINNTAWDAQSKINVKAVVAVDNNPALALLLWSFGAILFAVTCFWGVKLGIRERVPEYPSFDELLIHAKISRERLQTLDVAALEQLRWRMKGLRISPAECTEVFDRVISPAVLDSELAARWNFDKGLPYGDGWGRHQVIESVIGHLLFRADGEEVIGAVPTSYSVMKASEPPTKSNLKGEQPPLRPESP